MVRNTLNTALIALAIALAASAQLAAQSQAVVTAADVQIMAQPSFSAETLAPVGQGSQLRVLEVNGDWVRVLHGQQQGYVHSAFVTITTSQPQGSVQQSSPSQQPTFSQGVSAPRQGLGAIGPGSPGYKDPGTARLIGVLVTGGGQFYAGKTGKGLALLGVSLGSWLIGSAMSAASINDCAWDDYTCDYSASYTPLYVGAAVSLGAWAYGWYSAASDAQEHNVRQAYQTYGSLPAQPILAPSRDGGLAVGMRVRVQ